MTDWFNYGFDEVSWRDYGRKKRGVLEEKDNIEKRANEAGRASEERQLREQDQPSNEQDVMAMMQMMNNNGAGPFNPQMMAQMQPQQQMQFMSQMMANGGMGLEAMMAPFMPTNNGFGQQMNGFGMPQNGMGGMGGMFGGAAAGGYPGMQQQQHLLQQQQGMRARPPIYANLAPPPGAPSGPSGLRAGTANAGRPSASATPIPTGPSGSVRPPSGPSAGSPAHNPSGAAVKGDTVAGAGEGDKTDDNETAEQKEGVPKVKVEETGEGEGDKTPTAKSTAEGGEQSTPKTAVGGVEGAAESAQVDNNDALGALPNPAVSSESCVRVMQAGHN
jgi:hypothetical protein